MTEVQIHPQTIHADPVGSTSISASTSHALDIPIFSSLDECVIQNERLLNKIMSLEARLKAMPSFLAKIEQLEAQQREKDQIINGLQSKLEICQALVDAKMNEMLELRLTLDKEIREKHDLMDENATLDQRLEARNADCEELQGKLDQVNEAFENKEKDYARAARLVEDLQVAAKVSSASEEVHRQLQQHTLLVESLRGEISRRNHMDEVLKVLLQDKVKKWNIAFQKIRSYRFDGMTGAANLLRALETSRKELEGVRQTIARERTETPFVENLGEAKELLNAFAEAMALSCELQNKALDFQYQLLAGQAAPPMVPAVGLQGVPGAGGASVPATPRAASSWMTLGRGSA
jgi:hypothetical protein